MEAQAEIIVAGEIDVSLIPNADGSCVRRLDRGQRSPQSLVVARSEIGPVASFASWHDPVLAGNPRIRQQNQACGFYSAIRTKPKRAGNEAASCKTLARPVVGLRQSSLRARESGPTIATGICSPANGPLYFSAPSGAAHASSTMRERHPHLNVVADDKSQSEEPPIVNRRAKVIGNGPDGTNYAACNGGGLSANPLISVSCVGVPAREQAHG